MARLYSPLSRISDVGINQQAVHFRVNILDSDLKAIEEPRLWQLHFTAETIHLHTQPLKNI